MAIEWTEEEIAKRPDDEIKSLRENALRRGNSEIAARCEAELARRKPVKIKKAPPRTDVERQGQYVCEFHFVCPAELGVTKNPDGTMWTGTWVVAEINAENGKAYSSIVALHSARAELSYLQGIIVDWRKSQREKQYAEEQLVKTEFGIDFLIKPTMSPLDWKGDGAAEKGYAWAIIPSAN